MTEPHPPASVPVGAKPVVIGRSDGSGLTLADPTVSRRHATVRREAGRLVVEDHDSRYGTFVNGLRVRVVALNEGDRVRFGATVTYRVHDGGLQMEGTAAGMPLEVVGLGLDANDGNPGWGSWLRSTGVVRPLIRDVSFAVPADGFVGLLGPSGSGKSTVLAALAGRRPPDRGRVATDHQSDIAIDPDRHRAGLGVVPQDDIVHPTLTARENLSFAAELRLPGADRDAIAAAVERVLAAVNLTAHAGKRAGILSGGQRKRLSVAVELLRRPRLLLLDEPTSGLDPAGEARLMESLRSLSRQGTTVVCTTHLMDNLRLLDAVVTLGVVDGVGRLAYAGPPEGLMSHFGRRHIADVYDDLAAGRFTPLNPVEEPAARDPRATPTGPDRTAVPLGEGPVGSTTGVAQAATVARRAVRLLARDRALMAMMAIQPVGLGVLVGLTQYNIALDDVPRVLFFAIVIAIWLGLNPAARDLVRERRHYIRDRLAGLRPDAYLSAKALVHAGVGLGQVLLLLLVIRLTCGLVLPVDVPLPRTTSTWVGYVAVLWLAHLGGVGEGLLISTLARTEEAAVAALPLVILPQLLVSAVAIGGIADQAYSKPRPFRPIVVTLRQAQPLPPAARMVDVGSMTCLSRPASLLVDPKKANGFGPWTWVGDLGHLLILILAAWTAVILAFNHAERRWLRTPGS